MYNVCTTKTGGGGSLNSTPNIWYKQAYVQGFDCEYISFKKYVYMFERTETTEYIYEGVV